MISIENIRYSPSNDGVSSQSESIVHPPRLTKKMQIVFNQSSLPNETIPQMLSRLYQDRSRLALAQELGITNLTLKSWFRLWGVVERSVKEARGFRKPKSPEEKKQKIIKKIGRDPTEEIITLLKQGKTVKQVSQELNICYHTCYHWLAILGINITKGFYLYQEAKKTGLIDVLTKRQQEVVSLHFEDNKTINDIIELLGTSRQNVYGLISRALKKLKNSPEKEEKKELTGLAYLQVMFPGRLGMGAYNVLKRNGINTLEELKSFLPKVHNFRGMGPKGAEACVNLLKHFFPEDDTIINPLSIRSEVKLPELVDQPLPQIDQQVLEKWQESRQNEAKLDKIGLPDDIFNVFQEADWTLKKIVNIPDDNLLRLLGSDIRKLIAVRKALIDNNIVSKNSDLTTELNLLGLPTKTTRALRKAHIETLKELCSLTEEQVLSIINIGPSSLGLIRLNLTRLKNELEAL